MALSNFSVKAKGLDGLPYRIDVNGGGTFVTADGQFFALEGGESEDRGLDPIWPTEARVYMREDVDISPLFGQEERSVPVKAYDITGGTDTLVFAGYMITDFYRDTPFSPLPLVELRALDGLGLIENDSITQFYSIDEFVPYQSAIVDFLQSAFQLDVEIAVQWYPEQGGLTSSDNPLESVGFIPNNYREERPEGEYFNQLETLRDILKSIGATVRQADRRAENADARWHVRQRDAINSDGTVKVWTYTDAPDSPSPTTLDRSQSLSLDRVLEGAKKGFIQRRQTVRVTHDHVPLSNFVGDDGFEDAGAGNPTPWSIGNTSKLTGSVVSHDVPDNTPDASQDNTYVAQIKGDPDGGNNFPQDTPEFPISQTIDTVTGAQPNTAARVRQRFEGNSPVLTAKDEDGILLRISIGSYWLGVRSEPLTASVKSGQGSLYCEAIQRPIPAGAVLPVVATNTGGQPGNEYEGSITLAERAEEGDTELLGELSSEFDSTFEVLYPSVETTQQAFPIQRFVDDPRIYPTFEIVFAFEDPSGTPLEGEINYEVGGIGLIEEGDFDGDNLTEYRGDAVYIDNIEFGLERNESEIDQTVSTATVPELGETEEQTVRTSSGPTTQNLARLRGDTFEPTEWRINAPGSSTGRSAGDSLAELKAYQRLRYWQNHNERLTVTAAARDGTLPLTGDELVTLDGTDYTVHSVSYDAASGESRATLIEYGDYQ